MSPQFTFDCSAYDVHLYHTALYMCLSINVPSKEAVSCILYYLLHRSCIYKQPSIFKTIPYMLIILFFYGSKIDLQMHIILRK